jgi:hypothetical protein
VGTDMAIIRLPVTDLSSDPANMRTHPEANILAIVASLRRWGQQKPIVIDASHVVRCGNGTLEAARRLGWETIDCIVTALSGAELTAFAIADNRTSELAEWSAELAATLEALAADLPDLDAEGLSFDSLIDTAEPPQILDGSNGTTGASSRSTSNSKSALVCFGEFAGRVDAELVASATIALTSLGESPDEACAALCRRLISSEG